MLQGPSCDAFLKGSYREWHKNADRRNDCGAGVRGYRRRTGGARCACTPIASRTRHPLSARPRRVASRLGLGFPNSNPNPNPDPPKPEAKPNPSPSPSPSPHPNPPGACGRVRDALGPGATRGVRRHLGRGRHVASRGARLGCGGEHARSLTRNRTRTRTLTRTRSLTLTRPRPRTRSLTRTR